MKFLVSFKSNNKTIKPKGSLMEVEAPSDMLALEWAEKQMEQWNQPNLDVNVDIINDSLDEYTMNSSKLSLNFMVVVNKAVEDRRKQIESEANVE